MTWSRTWRLSMEWGSGFESFRFSLQNGPLRFPNLFWKVRENEKEIMTETCMKSRLFTSRLDEKNIFGMETQKPADTARCLPIFLSSLFTLYYSLFPTLLWASSAHPLVSPAGRLGASCLRPTLVSSAGGEVIGNPPPAPSHAPTSPEGDSFPAWEGEIII